MLLWREKLHFLDRRGVGLSLSIYPLQHTRDAVRLGALALYNLVPLAKEPWISQMLIDGFTRLIPSEPDPLARVHRNYRLALVQTRGRNALDAARAAGDAAVAETEGATADPRPPLFVAWARNGRAFVRARFRFGGSRR